MQERPTGGRFAASAFTNNSQGFSLLYGKRNIVNCPDCADLPAEQEASGNGEMLFKIFNPYHGVGFIWRGLDSGFFRRHCRASRF